MGNKNNWKTKTLILGAVLGAVTGLAAAFIFVNQAEENNDKPEFSAGQGVKLGLGVLGLLRLISDSGQDK